MSSNRAAGRPRSEAVSARILEATQDLLIEVGFERLTIDAVAARVRASKNTIYRRWPGKTELIVAAVAALREPPPVPRLGTLRENLLACARAYADTDDRRMSLLMGLATEMTRNPQVSVAAQEALGSPYARLFLEVVTSAPVDEQPSPDVDLDLVAAVFPAFAFHRLVVEGKPVDEEFGVRIVDGVLLPLLTR